MGNTTVRKIILSPVINFLQATNGSNYIITKDDSTKMLLEAATIASYD